MKTPKNNSNKSKILKMLGKYRTKKFDAVEEHDNLH